MKQHKTAFTLIELLIVVAIIAILAAIAVPNFLEAQTRSKVSRVKADMRSVATALEAYCVDNNNYPWPGMGSSLFLIHLYRLTTPIAYITSVGFKDPFMPKDDINPNSLRYFNYADRSWWIPDNDMYGKRAYCLHSYGPDGDSDGGEHFAHRLYPGHPEWGEPQRYSLLYNPTNGTRSSGDIIYIGGDTAYGGGMID